MTTPASARTSRPFLSAQWRDLAMLNYRIDPRILQPLVPRATELDTWDGEALVSVVGFMFLDTRVLGVPVPFHRNFEEVNLRFYVRRKVDGEWRRAVAFIKELVPRQAIALTARYVYNEPYTALPMSHAISREGDLRSVRYGWRHRGGDYAIQVTARGEPQALVDGSAEEFIAQHYWGYVSQRDSSTIEYEVEHPRWRAWRCESASLQGDFAALYGASYAEALAAEPASAFLAEGSWVKVHRGHKVA